jgi:hypothetical protein
MQKPMLKLYKQRQSTTNLKPCNIYADTHEKLNALSQSCGIPIVKLVAFMVDFSMKYIEVVEPGEGEDET